MELKKYFDKILSNKERKRIRKQFILVFEISKGTASNWLNGKCCPPEYTHVAIAEIMGVSVAELFPNTEKCSA